MCIRDRCDIAGVIIRDIAGVIVRDIALNIANVLSLKDFKRMEYRALLNFNQSLWAALKITQKYIKHKKLKERAMVTNF